MLSKTLKSRIRNIINKTWKIRKSPRIPSKESISFEGGGVNVEAAFLYSDLMNSSSMPENIDKTLSAKIYKSFLHVSSIIIKKQKGDIVSFDGDRIMAAFSGKNYIQNAVEAALLINSAIENIVCPILTERFTSIELSGLSIKQVTGVSAGQVLVVRAGIIGTNDRVWVGTAVNEAAKLSDIRKYGEYRTIISQNTFDHIPQSIKDSHKWFQVTHEGNNIYLSNGQISVDSLINPWG